MYAVNYLVSQCKREHTTETEVRPVTAKDLRRKLQPAVRARAAKDIFASIGV